MKVTVTNNFLNVRVGAPSLNAPANTYLSPGDVIEVHDTLYKGDSYEGIDDWHGDDANHFYWSGGTTVGDPATAIFYNRFLKQFNQQVLSTQGAGTTVIVIDEGMIQNSAYFDPNNTRTISIDPGPILTDHGNFIGGILAGKSSVIGLVPKAQLISMTFKTNTTPPSQFLQNMITALQQIQAQPGPSIVNLSQAFSKYTMTGHDAQKATITSLMQQISAQSNKFVICSAGDNAEINFNLFPASTADCISVGCLDSDKISLAVPSTLNILSPLVNYTSFGLDFKPSTQVGCSFTTAIITALASCIISNRLPAITQKSDLLASLKKYSTDRSQFQFGNLANFQYQIT